MTAQFARTPYRGRSGGSTTAEPHAALLIDFDNVTMGIRSDLTKELKNLLNSDIIKGKVAVQRAYADWRRYPQYIVPLAESSVDLIFAPAYGSAKKNATDIRLAIDATELVFTRPEIGTIILLSGDSDFSSLVLKLKEYGKYVIGVGIRESASDLLVQNCDEYYSYSALTGLTRAGEEAPVVSEDPWELVELGVKQMIDNGDVMRSDRLKQVLLEMDPSFDEKSLGFQKFNKFVQEAATRGVLSLRKQENGQYEVGPPSEGGVPESDAAASEARESRRGRGRRGRGRRDEGRPREERKDQLELSERGAVAGEEPGREAAPSESTAPSASAGTPPAAPVAEPATDVPSPAAAEAAQAAAEAEAEAEAATKKPRRRSRKPAKETAAAVDAAAESGTTDPREAKPAAEPAAARSAGDGAGDTGDVSVSYDLLRRATADLVRKNGPAVRDSDVKRRMLELQAGWDESAHGFSKFSRFLRRAHDAGVVTLRQSDGGNYDVLPGDSDAGEEPRASGGGRGRGRDRESAPRTSQVSEPSRQERTPAAAAATQATPPADSARSRAPAQAAAAEAAPAQSSGQTGGQSAALGFRRGSRGRSAPSGPPPLLEGQTAPRATPAAAAQAKDAEGGAKTEPARRSTTKKTSARKAPKAAKKAATGTGANAPAAKSGRGPAKAAVNAAALGLPTDAGDIANHLTAYKGVGPKSVQLLIEKFGAARVFDTLETNPDAVRDVMGARAETLLDAWTDDIAARRAAAAPDSSARSSASASQAGARKGPRRGGRRGGRKGSTAGK